MIMIIMIIIIRFSDRLNAIVIERRYSENLDYPVLNWSCIRLSGIALKKIIRHHKTASFRRQEFWLQERTLHVS